MQGFPDKLPGEDFIHSWYPILIALVGGLIFGLRNYMKGPECRGQEKMKDKTVIVTGASSGIGLETVKDLAGRGARVIMGCRDVTKGKAAVEEMKLLVKNANVVVMKLDLASFKSVREFVKEFKEKEDGLDVLINNAGIMNHPGEKTEDGHDIHLQTNYLGHFLLTHLLLDELKESAPARIINVTALAYRIGELNFDDLNGDQKPEYKPGEMFAQSKLAVVLFTVQLATELEGTNVTANVIHPGIVNSDHHRHMPFQKSALIRITFAPIFWYFAKRPKDGAQTILQCAVAKEEEGVSGKYYCDTHLADLDPVALDEEKAKKLWDVSLKLCKLQKAVEK